MSESERDFGFAFGFVFGLVFGLVLATCQCVVNFFVEKGGVKSLPRLSFSLLKELQAGLGGCQFYSIIFPFPPLFFFVALMLL